MNNIKIFNAILRNTLYAAICNSLIWFGLIFWVFLNTKSVLATSWISGIFALSTAVSSLFLGAYVDHNKKKDVMKTSTVFSLCMYILALGVWVFFLKESSILVTSIYLWIFIVLCMFGSVAGNIRIIALSTTVSILFDEKDRGFANGKVGAMNGTAFAVTSVLSGLLIGFLGIEFVLLFVILGTIFILYDLKRISFLQDTISIISSSFFDTLRGFKKTMQEIKKSKGLFFLIFFTTWNNFLGGVFMALMDPYGLSLVRVETWGIIIGVLSFSFILGGLCVSKYGLGKNPLKTMFLVNTITWFTCILFPLQSSIILLGFGMFTWMFFFPFVEASEQTIIQKLIPFEKQGRVFGFAQSIESSASPVTTFIIGPLAQLIFIPFMTYGKGVDLIGSWFGSGSDRGIALVFMCVGIVGTIATLILWRSKYFKILSKQYLLKEQVF